MRVVVKIGGTLLDDAAGTQAIACELKGIAHDHELVVVHGGGKQVTRFLEERSVPTRFVNGLRVSDEAVIDGVTKVIAGSVNKRLIAAIIAEGGRAVGLSGVDGALTVAEALDPELGYVGKPGPTDPQLLQVLVDRDFLPVVACLAAGRDGTIYNVNADQMAVSCALGWSAETILFLTDVEGVKDCMGGIFAEIAAADIERLIETGVAQGGMQAKLRAAEAALKAGIQEVIIASGRQRGICRRVLGGERVGTRLVAHSAPPVAAKA